MTVYQEIHDHDEDCRVDIVGKTCMENPGAKIGFVTDDWPGKPERYIMKVTQRFPLVEVLAKGKGPVAETVLICFIYQPRSN